MKIGKIISIEHDIFRVKILSELTSNSINLSGQIYYFGNIGSYVKVKNSLNESIFCEIISIFTKDTQQGDLNQKYDALQERLILIKPIGTITKQNTFEMGISIFPAIYSDIEIVTFDDMEIILANNKKTENTIHQSIDVGTSKNLINYPVKININKFFNIHSAILGNSGSGKSNTISSILQKVIKKDNNYAHGAKFVIFDVNGEYKTALNNKNKNSNIQIKHLKPNTENDKNPFFVPHFLLNAEEWAAFLLATDATQRPFWEKVLQESYKFYKFQNSQNNDQISFDDYIKCRVLDLTDNILSTIDSDTAMVTMVNSLVYSFEKLLNKPNIEYPKTRILLNALKQNTEIKFGNNEKKIEKCVEEYFTSAIFQKYYKYREIRLPHGEYFDSEFISTAVDWVLLEEEARGNKRVREYTSTMIARLDHFFSTKDCTFMRDEESEIKNHKDFRQQLFGDKNKSIQISIIDTSELTPYSLETLTSVTSRLLFDQQKNKDFNKNRNTVPIHLILDEAHRYMKKDTKYLMSENIFEKISREGRKFALYLMISSQRPSELSDTVLSQCGNFIVHRIQNQIDMNFIANVMPFFSDDLRSKIKLCVPGEAVIFGNCVPMPLQVKINKPNPQPHSQDCDIPKAWFKHGVQSANTPPD